MVNAKLQKELLAQQTKVSSLKGQIAAHEKVIADRSHSMSDLASDPRNAEALLLLMELDLLVKMYKLTTEHAVIPLRVGPALMRVRARRAPHRRRACIRSRQAACRQ